MDREDVEYFVDGTRIRGWLYLPLVAEGGAPGIVFCPGYSGTRYAAFYQPYVERMVAEGYAVLLSDYRGWGDSEGSRGVIDPRLQTDDIRAGLTYLETRREIHGTRLGLFGVSFGGGHAGFVAGVDPRVTAAVAISAVADGRDWLQSMRRAYEWDELLERLANERRRLITGADPTLVHPNTDIQVETPERRATKVKGNVDPRLMPDQTPLICADSIIDYSPLRVIAGARGVLLVCLEQDSVVPPTHSAQLYAAAQEPKRLVVLPGKSHYAAYTEQLDAIWSETRSWFRSKLFARDRPRHFTSGGDDDY